MFYSAVLLVYVVSTAPVQIRLVDRIGDLDTCTKIVETVRKQELNEPEEDRIGGRLQCIVMSYKSDMDKDGPTKTVVPEAPNMPSLHKEGDAVFSCYNQKKKSVVCRSTSM